MNLMPIEGVKVLALLAAIVLGAFVSEDGATIAAATLAASSVLDLRLAFLGAFTGLWVGDMGVYALARHIGTPLAQHRWFKSWVGSSFAKSRHGASRANGSGERLRLAASRFFPGTRLPAYISAGLGRMPAIDFATITALSASAWILLVFAAIHLAPSRAMAARQQLGLLSVCGLGIFAVLAAWRRWNGATRRQFGIVVERIVKWEFWPAWVFYPPVAVMCVWLGIRYRGFSLPTISNLNQRNGGMIGESKIGILLALKETAPEFTAEAHLIPAGTLEERMEVLEEIRSRREIDFPFVLKPDTAQRGAGFKKIASFEEAAAHLSQITSPLVLQKYVAGPLEAGIFYYRFPRQEQGQILGITRKQFPVVVGDGAHSLRELIETDPRARLIARTYLDRFWAEAERIPASGERVRLVEAGNHCQGCIFQDGRDLYTEELRATLDGISRKLAGFYIGRYDVRYRSDEELRTGQGFQILELNGAASEATNIYDGANSLWSAYATLYQQWKLVYQIGALNRDRGHMPATPLAVFRDWIAFSRQAVEYPAAD